MFATAAAIIDTTSVAKDPKRRKVNNDQAPVTGGIENCCAEGTLSAPRVKGHGIRADEA